MGCVGEEGGERDGGQRGEEEGDEAKELALVVISTGEEEGSGASEGVSCMRGCV